MLIFNVLPSKKVSEFYFILKIGINYWNSEQCILDEYRIWYYLFNFIVWFVENQMFQYVYETQIRELTELG